VQRGGWGCILVCASCQQQQADTGYCPDPPAWPLQRCATWLNPHPLTPSHTHTRSPPRFNFFCEAALAYMRVRNVRPDIVHCHDWQSAPIAWGDKNGAKSVFTIHNLNYGADLVGRAMAAAQVATTVSPTYAREISGHPAIAPNLGKLYGIRWGDEMG
jgi:hypothetical protein